MLGELTVVEVSDNEISTEEIVTVKIDEDSILDVNPSDNTYKGEMLRFIGIDNTPGNYKIPVTMDYPEILIIVIIIFDKYHMYEILPENVRNQIIIY